MRPHSILPHSLAATVAFLALPVVAAAQIPVDHGVRVDEIFAEWDLATSPGCAVGVAWDGLTVLEEAWGMANLEFGIPNTPETIFEAGSVSKQFTAAATTLLAMEGALSIDDDVREYIPEVPDYGETVTIRHMMNHTSGLRDWGSVAGISGWGRGDRTHDHGHVLDIVSRQTRLNFEPGYEYSYSNTGYNLQAILVSRVAGMSFRDFSEQRIFAPLGLDDTQWRDDYQRIVPGRATAYSPRGDGFRINHPIEDVHGNGGLLTTVGDLLTWARSFDEARLAGPEFVQRMETRGVLNSGATIAYAAGLSVGDRRGVRSVTHTGATSGYRAFLGRYYPGEHTLAVAVLCNVSNANPGGLGGEVADVYASEWYAASRPEPAMEEDVVAVPVSTLRSYAGLYARDITGQPIEVTFGDGRLRGNGEPMFALSEREFAVDGDRGEVARFESNGTGRATLVQVEDGHETARYLPVDRWSPGIGELEPFVGTYHSDDAQTTYAVTLEDGRLVAERYPNPVRRALTPAAYTDAFDEGTIRFHRDASGRVVEMSTYSGRVYDMRFRRVQRSPPPPSAWEVRAPLGARAAGRDRASPLERPPTPPRGAEAVEEGVDLRRQGVRLLGAPAHGCEGDACAEHLALEQACAERPRGVQRAFQVPRRLFADPLSQGDEAQDALHLRHPDRVLEPAIGLEGRTRDESREGRIPEEEEEQCAFLGHPRDLVDAVGLSREAVRIAEVRVRLLEESHLPVGDAEVVVRLSEATGVPDLVVGADRARVVRQRLGQVVPERGDDAEIVARTGGEFIVVRGRRVFQLRQPEVLRAPHLARLEPKRAEKVQPPPPEPHVAVAPRRRVEGVEIGDRRLRAPQPPPDVGAEEDQVGLDPEVVDRPRLEEAGQLRVGPLLVEPPRLPEEVGRRVGGQGHSDSVSSRARTR